MSKRPWCRLALAGLLLLPGFAHAAEERSANIPAIIMFLIFVLATLGITYWAAQRNKSTSDFYTAGGGITGFKNGLAIAGDYMSAASFLGISGMVFAVGYDGLIYSTGFLVGWPIVLFIIAERLRNLGRFTFSDVAAYRLSATPLRILSASGTLSVVLVYLIAQVVGAGKLIELLFGIQYYWAVIIVSVLMILYVLFGGMLATTWVQIIKAVLLLFGATFMSLMVLISVNFSFDQLFTTAISAHSAGEKIMGPGGLVANPIDALSLGIALMFGTAGLPHILMRFFTVRDAKQARKSVFVATAFIGYFYILTFIIGFGAIMFLSNNASYMGEGGDLIGGINMAAVHLAGAVGGNLFLGFISAVAFATILAVVAGLTLSGASAVSHDLYASVIKKGQASQKQELLVSRLATLALGVISIVLGLAFEYQNVAFMVGLAFAIAASANFPILVLSMFWRGLTTRGATVGGFAGLIAAVVLIILGPTVWVSVLHNAEAIFPYGNPALFSIPTTFIVAWLFSITDKSARASIDKAGFEQQYVRSVTGIGASGAEKH